METMLDMKTVLAGCVFKTAADVFRAGQLPSEDGALVKEGMTPGAFVEAALSSGNPQAAIRFLGAALPKRKVIEWGLRVARQAGPGGPEDAAACAAIEAWLAKPSDQNRRACYALVEKHALEMPSLLVAFGVFLSEGSMAPANVEQQVVAAPHLTGQVVANAIVLSGVMRKPEMASEAYDRYIRLLAQA